MGAVFYLGAGWPQWKPLGIPGTHLTVPVSSIRTWCALHFGIVAWHWPCCDCYTNCVKCCALVLALIGVVAAVGSTQASPFYHRKLLLSLDQEQNSVSFVVKALPRVLNHVEWLLLIVRRNNGAFPRWKLSIASRIGSKIFFTHYHWAANMLLS